LHEYIIQLTHAAGAGISGLALAMALHKKGISFTLYEEAKEFSAVG
jgi:salicylate hydroxylase